MRALAGAHSRPFSLGLYTAVLRIRFDDAKKEKRKKEERRKKKEEKEGRGILFFSIIASDPEKSRKITKNSVHHQRIVKNNH